MPTIAELVVAIRGDNSGLKKALSDSSRDVQQSFGSIQGTVAKFGAAVGSLALIIKGIDFNKTMESAKVAFGAMLGGATQAADMVAKLQKLAIETPMTFKEVQDGAKQLVAFGIAGKDIVPTMKKIGDVAAGLNIPIGDMAYLFGTVRTQGVAMTRDLMQFANRGVPIFEALATVMNTTEQGVRKFAEQGKITFDIIDTAFSEMTKEGAAFNNMMLLQMDTLIGAQSNLNDAFERALGAATERATPALKAAFKELTEAITNNIEGLKSIGDAIGIVIQGASWLISRIVELSKYVNLLIPLGAAVGLAFGPWGMLIGAAVTAAASLIASIKRMNEEADTFTKSAQDMANRWVAIGDAEVAARKKAEKEREDARKKALEEAEKADKLYQEYLTELYKQGEVEADLARRQTELYEQWKARETEKRNEVIATDEAFAIAYAERVAADKAAWEAQQQAAIDASNETTRVLGDNYKVQEEQVRVATEEWAGYWDKAGQMVLSSLGEVFSIIGENLFNNQQDWTNLGKAAIKSIAAIIKALGDQLAAMAAARLIEAIAASFSLVLAWTAPGLFESASILSGGAIAAWGAAGALNAWADSLATGTQYARGGRTLVGEQGPEIVDMPEGARVHTAQETANMRGGYVVNINSPKQLNVIEAARLMKSTMRQLTFAGGY